MATSKDTNIGVKDIAEKVGTTPRTLRMFLRSQGIGVGSGARYTWPSMSDPAVRKIIREFGKTKATDEVKS